MSWWSAEIMGGDGPLDIKGDFDDYFQTRQITADAAVEFLAEQRYDGDEGVPAQVVGFLVMERAVEFSNKLRTLVLDGCDDDAGWKAMGDCERDEIMAKFRSRVAAYGIAGTHKISDRDALDQLAKLFKLSHQEWQSDSHNLVGDIVEATGRKL